MKTLYTINTKKIFDIIKNAGGEARFVGGCVRDSLLDKTPHDIDFAVNLPPETVSDALNKHGITVIPTGISHGTVTAVFGKETYELTTLRVDTKTDGRHAVVEFTDDWEKDAARRDFTINQIYMDANGKIYDYFNGVEDLKNGIVRFIGNPEDRIIEDYLRILRWFRFNHRYSMYELNGRMHVTDAIDSSDARACAKLADNLSKVSVERIWSELKNILTLDGGVFLTIKMMEQHGILDKLFPGIEHKQCYTALAYVCGLEYTHDCPNPVRRLASILCGHTDYLKYDEVKDFALKWKLSDDERQTLLNVLSPDIEKTMGDDCHSEKSTEECCYVFGVRATLDYTLCKAAKSRRDWKKRFKVIKRWDNKQLPISGKDLLAIGVKPGPAMGKLLKNVEKWWIDNDMRPAKSDCLSYVRKYLKNI
jgi:poly(A) polymerase